MPKLKHRDSGTVVTVPDRLEGRYRARGYIDHVDPVEDVPTGNVCDDCGFEAKTAAGLGAHRRSHDDGGTT
jgi:hypothetical protein